MKTTLPIIVVLFVTALAQAAGPTEEDAYLKVDTSDGFLRKLDVALPPEYKGMYSFPAGGLAVIAMEQPKSEPLTEENKRGFLKGMYAGGPVEIDTEKKTAFCGLDAYRFGGTWRTDKGTCPVSVLLSSGNGFIYTFMVLGSDCNLPDEAVSRVLDHISLSKAEKHQRSTNTSAISDSPAYRFGYLMGRIAIPALLLVALVLVLFVIKVIRKLDSAS